MFNKLWNKALEIHGGKISSGLLEAANEFLKDYEKTYIKFWTADWTNDQKELGAVHEARMIGKKYFGITSEAFEFIQFKVENTYKSQLKPLD